VTFLVDAGRFRRAHRRCRPVKASAGRGLRALESEGIRVIMLTGDNELTAGAVAERTRNPRGARRRATAAERPGKAPRPHDAAQIGLHQRDARALDGDVGPRPWRAYIGLGEGGRVVHAVPAIATVRPSARSASDGAFLLR